MPGRHPKPPDQRRRRNLDSPQWRKLDPTEHGKMPPYPASIVDQPEACEWWRRVWADPMSVLYLPSDHLALERAAKLHHLIINGHPRVTNAGDEVWEPGSPAEMSELRQIEDRFGLNPKSRRLLQWEVSQAGGSETPAPRPPSRVRELRAVDGGG